MIVDERPDLFPAHMDRHQRVEAARMWVRRAFGLAGDSSYIDTGHLRRPARQLVLSPPPADQLPSTDPVQLPPYEHAYILADLHVPYHHADLVDHVIAQIGRDRPDAVILLGDVIDCAAISRHSHYGHETSIGAEAERVEHLLESIRTAAPAADIIWKHGNHEDRVRRYWSDAGMAAEGMEWLAQRIDIADLRVRVVPAWVVMEMIVDSDKIVMAHGHEQSTSGRHPAERAWQHWGKLTRYVMIGHNHYVDRYIPPGIGPRCAAYALGCLAQRQPYRAGNTSRWMCGYAVWRDGKVHITEFDD